MKSKNKVLLLLAASAPLAAITIAGCGGSSGGGSNGGGNQPQLGKIGVWMTTSVQTGNIYTQQERLARPLINEVFATVSNNRHKINNRNVPAQDRAVLKTDIVSFMKFPAGRSDATADIVATVLTPDMMMVDLAQAGPASYLGVETGGFTGGKFGGRKMTDDVVDLSLGVIFGDTVAKLGLAPDDGAELDGRVVGGVTRPNLTSDNVGVQSNVDPNRGFPYVAPPA